MVTVAPEAVPPPLPLFGPEDGYCPNFCHCPCFSLRIFSPPPSLSSAPAQTPLPGAPLLTTCPLGPFAFA